VDVIHKWCIREFSIPPSAVKFDFEKGQRVIGHSGRKMEKAVKSAGLPSQDQTGFRTS
jgi:hypothetical protein